MTRSKHKEFTVRQQLRAIMGVAAISFRMAPGAVIFKLVGSVINAVLPIVTTYLAARTTTTLAQAAGGNGAAKSQIIVLIVLTAAAGLLMTVWSSVDAYIQSKMRFIVQTKVSNNMFEHFLSLDFWRYDDKHTADLYDRSQKFSQFFSWIFDRLATVVSHIVAMVSAIVALLLVSKWIALFVLVAVLPGIYVQFKLSRKQVALWNENVEVRRSLSLIEWNMLQPRLISELRLYGMVQYLLKLRMSLREKDERARIDVERQTIPLALLANVIEAAAEVVALIWVTGKIINAQQPLGAFLYVQQLVSRAISSASSLTTTISSIDEDVANLFDYEQFMQLPRQHTGTRRLAGVPAAIRCVDLSFRYPGKQSPNVLHNINLQIDRNQHIAIVGENGAGKSTLIKLLTGLYKPTSGQILFDDVPLQEYDIASWHKLLGVLQQDFISYGFATARQNVQYGDIGRPYSKERMQRALAQAEAADFTTKLPNGLDSYVDNWMEDDKGNKGKDLSGGQWQRLALARNFYRDAPVIILDEPTSAIDALAESRIFKQLFAAKDRTVITISHRLSTVKKADVIYVLAGGKIVEQGTYDELLARHGHFYTMFESQINA